VNSDPITVILEGSNASLSRLTLGSSWTLIYNGSNGLGNDPGGGEFGVTQWVSSNSIWYLSYRILVTSKRGGETMFIILNWNYYRLLTHTINYTICFLS
jgi:hypothetical protein